MIKYVKKNNVVMDFLLSRRSNSAQSLVEPIPNFQDIDKILSAAARTPDHGKLVPWRFLVLEKKTMPKLAQKIHEIGVSKRIDNDKLKKNANTFLNAPLIIAVVFSPKSSKKVPLIEQHLSAGAVCLALLNAALADGWGANWLTGWMSRDKAFLQSALCLKEGEFVAGFIHLGTPKVSPIERERPNINEITEWL
tara:strand:+ start:564 stop:1145 length:582 start_codon:yes stop_codon:yes gene_type:complete